MPSYLRKLKKGDRWYYKFDCEGKTYFSEAIYKTKQEAKKAEAERLAFLETDEFNEAEVDTLTAIFDRLKFLKITTSKKYYNENKRYLDIFHEYFKEHNLTLINRNEAQTFIMELTDSYRKNGHTNHSVNSAIRCYKAFYNFVNEFYILKIPNPFLKIRLLPIEKKIKYVPSDDEISKLLSVCDRNQRRLVEFVMQTGARINEALNFTYADIFDDYIVLYTRKSRNSNLTPRKVPFPPCLKNLNRGKKEDRIFRLWTDRPKFLGKKLKKLGLDVWGWHNLRHRYASKLSKDNVPIFEIMSRLGHQSIETTQIYLQLLGD